MVGVMANLENNTFVYVDNDEMVHFGPFPRADDGPYSPERNRLILIIIALSGISVFLLLVILGIYLYHKCKSIYIVKQEINRGRKQKEEMLEWLEMAIPKRYHIPKSRIQFASWLLGAGQFGSVIVGKFNMETDVAIKIKWPNTSMKEIKFSLNEAKNLCNVGDGTHPNIIVFVGVCAEEMAAGRLYVLTEYYHNGTLLAYLRAPRSESTNRGGNQSVDIYQMYKFAHEIASGMEYISRKEVIHGNLGARNIFLNYDHTCKIGNFSLSVNLEEGDTCASLQNPVSVRWKWAAIETTKRMELSAKSDVWSYGITVWEIFSLGTEPYSRVFWSPNLLNELEAGMRLPKAIYASDDIHKKLLACWDMNPELRPSFTTLAQYFAGLRSEEYIELYDVHVNNSCLK